MMKSLFLTLTVFAALLLSVAVLGFVYIDHQFSNANAALIATRPLIQGLPINPQAAGREMKIRLLARFPQGSQAVELRTFLIAQGFAIICNNSTDKAYFANVERHSNLADFTRLAWYVTWREDKGACQTWMRAIACFSERPQIF